jgi:cadmium resistance protein CadD (predicted permease)
MDRLPVVLVSTFTIALLHTLIPSHWLCFVLVGKAQGWRRGKTLGVTAAAGAIHVATTVTLGIALAALGRTIFSQEHLLERVSAIILIGLGALYLGSHLLHAGHHHEQDKAISEKAAVVALVFSLVLSPCSASIPLLIVASASAGWTALALIAVVLLVTTVGVMLLMVGLTSLGIERLQFSLFERYEKLIVGLVLCALGALVLVVQH